MNREAMTERLFETLIAGDRPAARQVVRQALDAGVKPDELVTDYFWPTYENIDRLFRADQITPLSQHLATRLLRQLVDQNAARLATAPSRGRTVMAFCGASEADEMGAQMAVDLLEAAGFTVVFGGGGIANDEVLAQVNERQPDVLLMFASAPGDLPNIRALIDTLGEIGACQGLQIAVGAGVFNRAEGLAEEIGADLWATSPLELVEALIDEPERRADAEQRTVGKNRKKKLAA
jgi:methanogenic corrinoid protein MtbC1